MSRRPRPTALPLFATDPTAGHVVEPPSLTREGGFNAEEQPPAYWFNWLFNGIGQWLDYLRGPSLVNWTRVATTGNLITADVDDVTAEGATLRYRIVATDDSNTDQVWASVNGDAWLQRDVVPAAGTLGDPRVVAFTGVRWLLCTVDAGTGKVWWTTPSGVAGSAIDNEALPWSAATLPGGTTEPSDIAAIPGVDPNATVVMVTQDKILFSLSDGTSFANATLSGASTGTFVGVVWTGTAWVATTSTGEIWRATDAAGTWSMVADLASATWRLEADDGGTVVAYKHNAATADDWYVSTDHGATWVAQAAPALATHIKRLRFVGGTWLMCLLDAPYLAQGNELPAANWVRLPVPHPEAGSPDYRTNDVLLATGGLVVLGVGHSLLGLRGADTSPGPYSPSTGPAALHDAAYLRGNYVHDTTPAEGQALTWQRAAGATPARWAPDATVVGRVQTTDATVTTAASYTPDDGTTVTARVTVTGRKSDGSAAGGYVRLATFRRAGGVTTQVGATTAVADHEDVAGWDVTLDVSGTAIRVRVKGAAATTIDWTARIAVEVIAP